jgi:stage II sporulation protein D
MLRPTVKWLIAGVVLLFFIGLLVLPGKRGGRAKLALQPPPGVARFPAVRVLLTPDAVTTATVQVDGPFRISPLGSQKVLLRLDRLPKSTVTLTSNGFRLGTQILPVPRIEIVPDGEGAAWVGDREYRGKIQLIRQPGGRALIVNSVPLEDYIGGVVDSEMPREFGTEARKAQAVVARSYALSQMQTARRGSLFDLYATTRSQKYHGRRYLAGDGRLLAGDSADSRQIAYETAGMVCTDHGRLFCTYYSAVCGGSTSLGSDFFSDAAPPHQSVACQWCADSPLYAWQATVTNADLQSRIQKYWTSQQTKFGALKSLSIGSVPHAGGVAVIQMSDDKQTLEMPATAFRRIVGTSELFSHHFQVERDGTNWIFKGAGHGHGVGLCQWGARGLARSGKNFVDILTYYYPGSQVVILTEK